MIPGKFATNLVRVLLATLQGGQIPSRILLSSDGRGARKINEKMRSSSDCPHTHKEKFQRRV